MNPIIQSVTDEIIARSQSTRTAYLKYLDRYEKKHHSVLAWGVRI
jgi:hypothetical protein